jgi:hypothetical protein
MLDSFELSRDVVRVEWTFQLRKSMICVFELDFPHFNLLEVSTTNQKCSSITTTPKELLEMSSEERTSHLLRHHWKTSETSICLNDLQFISVSRRSNFRIDSNMKSSPIEEILQKAMRSRDTRHQRANIEEKSRLCIWTRERNLCQSSIAWDMHHIMTNLCLYESAIALSTVNFKGNTFRQIVTRGV